MTTIAILSQKGGAGKTTLAINLAGAAEAAGHQVVIIDLDPQASAKAWYDRRGKEHPVVISSQPRPPPSPMFWRPPPRTGLATLSSTLLPIRRLPP